MSSGIQYIHYLFSANRLRCLKWSAWFWRSKFRQRFLRRLVDSLKHNHHSLKRGHLNKCSIMVYMHVTLFHSKPIPFGLYHNIYIIILNWLKIQKIILRQKQCYYYQQGVQLSYQTWHFTEKISGLLFLWSRSFRSLLYFHIFNLTADWRMRGERRDLNRKSSPKPEWLEFYCECRIKTWVKMANLIHKMMTYLKKILHINYILLSLTRVNLATCNR